MDPLTIVTHDPLTVVTRGPLTVVICGPLTIVTRCPSPLSIVSHSHQKIVLLMSVDCKVCTVSHIHCVLTGIRIFELGVRCGRTWSTRQMTWPSVSRRRRAPLHTVSSHLVPSSSSSSSSERRSQLAAARDNVVVVVVVFDLASPTCQRDVANVGYTSKRRARSCHDDT